MIIDIQLVGYILLGAFGVTLLIQLYFYWFRFGLLAFYKKKETTNSFPPVSVIICARNEDDNLVKYLPLVCEQDYPEFEVVLVNDCSIDNTEDILRELERKHRNLRVITIKEDEYYSHGKKFAVMVGVKGAKYEHMLFTDADCKPNSDQWIKEMLNNYTPGTEIVLGYGGYEKLPGLLNKLIRFDTFMIALQYLSFALAGKTYMGVGRNLSYKKNLFFKLKGFASHYHIDSGDDDLFVNEAATKQNSKIEIAIASHTISNVKTSIKEWTRQKRRHLGTAKLYSMGSKVQLGLLSGSQMLFWILFITLLALQIQPIIILAAFGLRLITQIIILYSSMKKLNEKDLIYITPILELLLLLLYPLIVLKKIFSKKDKWKNR